MTRLHDELDVVAGDRELGHQAGDVRRLRSSDELGEGSPFPAPLALNVVPWVGALRRATAGRPRSSRCATRPARSSASPDLKVSATCVRVPVVTTHSVAVHATFAQRDHASRRPARRSSRHRRSWSSTTRTQREFPTPADVVGSDPTFVGRMRQALDFPNTLELFICGDNLRKGRGAEHRSQIAELVVGDLVPALKPR